MADGTFYSRVRLKATKGPCVVDRTVARTMAMSSANARYLFHNTIIAAGWDDWGFALPPTLMPIGLVSPSLVTVCAVMLMPCATVNGDVPGGAPTVGIVVADVYYPLFAAAYVGAPHIFTVTAQSLIDQPLYAHGTYSMPLEYAIFEVL